jgi:uncharacterized protein
MADPGATVPEPTEFVTSVITHAVRTGSESTYEDWLRRIIPIAGTFEGHQGVNILRPSGGTGTYTIALRFDSLEHLSAWLQSERRRALMAEITPLLARTETVETQTGLDFWFTSPAGGKAPRWKQFLATLAALFPLTLVIPTVFNFVADAIRLPEWPILRGFLILAANVALLTFVVMPRFTRLIRRWLYDTPS